MEDRIARALAEAGSHVPSLSYGTAGFRARHDLLDAVCVRMGMLCAARALQLNAIVGCCITASHNPVEDNGLKLMDPSGSMLAPAWEKHATSLARAASPAEVAATLAAICSAEGVAWPPAAPAAGVVSRAQVLLARDTRPHSERLLARVAAGVAAVAGDSGAVSVGDCGLLTTPQLHHIVRARNLEAAGISLPGVPAEPRLGSVEGYHAELARAYAALLTATAPEAGLPPSAAAAVAAQAVSRGPLHVDCANGVGGRHSRLLAAAMGSAGSAAAGSAAGSAPHLLDMVVHNAGDTAEEAALLNEGVGAEHCQKGRAPPATGFEPASDYAGVRCASLDGDADRVVFWYYSKADAAGAGAGAPVVWHLLDGDKIAALAAAFIADQLADLGMPLTPHPTHAPHGEADDSHAHAAPSAASAAAAPVDPAAPVSVGVVQTAYANGASSDYIRGTLRLPVALAKTGVKFVHAAAAAFDVGVYFEANGHGTVLFHESFLARLLALDVASLSPKQAAARARLLAASRLINQAIGDALSDAMFVEAVLALKGWSVSQWDAIYSDLPSAQAKMAVPDRSAVRVSEDETRVLHPAALQDAIDAAVAAVPRGRAFVRPSGTEDCVRFYAEAADEASAKALLAAVQDATRRILIS